MSVVRRLSRQRGMLYEMIDKLRAGAASLKTRGRPPLSGKAGTKPDVVKKVPAGRICPVCKERKILFAPERIVINGKPVRTCETCANKRNAPAT
jgi:hypothetical protein